MPFQFRSYFETLWRSLFIEAPWTLPRVLIMFGFAFLFPIAQLFNALTLMLDNIFFPGYRKVEVKEPVFIIGNARSGTTYMHRLMALDTEQFNSFKLSDLIFISVGAKKLLQTIGRIDHRLGGHLQKGLENLQASMLKEADKVHKLRLSQPEEDDGVLVHCWASAFLALLFPVPCMQEWEKFDELSDKKRLQLMNFYKACVQRQLYVHGGSAMRILSKNPLFSTKIATLYQVFPDAKIVYMARTPYETVASLHNMIDRIWNVQLKLPKSAQPREGLTRMCIYSYKYALEELDRHDQSSHIIVRYEDLVHEPRATVEAIYRKFNIPMTPRFVEVLTRTTDKTRGYKSEHQYSLEQFGLTRERVYNETREVFARFGFDREGEFAHDPGVAPTVQVA